MMGERIVTQRKIKGKRKEKKREMATAKTDRK